MAVQARRFWRKVCLVAVFSAILLPVRMTPLQVRLDCGLTIVEMVLVFLIVCLSGSAVYDALFHWRQLWTRNAGRR